MPERVFCFSWRGPSFWRACPTQISLALLFLDGLALPKYFGMRGVIWVFWWCFVRFGSFGGVLCDFGVLWFLYKIHGFRQGILCFGDHVIFEWVGTLGQGGPIKFVTFAYFLYDLHRIFPIPKDRPKIGSKLNFVTIHSIPRDIRVPRVSWVHKSPYSRPTQILAALLYHRNYALPLEIRKKNHDHPFL